MSPTTPPNGRFEALVKSEDAGRVLKYGVRENDRRLRYSDVLDLWEQDSAFVDFYLSIFKNCGFHTYAWETPALSTALQHRDFEFVIVNARYASGRPDRDTFASYFDRENAREGIVAFDNLGRDALLVVPSPLREDADYSGLAQFFSEAPLAQQRALWHEVGVQAKARLSDRPLWLSVAGGGVYWLHIRLDSAPKYYRYRPYTAA